MESKNFNLMLEKFRYIYDLEEIEIILQSKRALNNDELRFLLAYYYLAFNEQKHNTIEVMKELKEREELLNQIEQFFEDQGAKLI
jgi:hypothetical protein